MRLKKVIKELLKDWKHWLGWTISALTISFIVILVFRPFINFFLLFIPVFIVEVIVDIFKHWVKLQ